MMLRILNNPALNDEDRFIMLTNNLSGSAFKTIEYLDINPANYLLAWQMLDEMFLNQRICIEELFAPHLEGKFKIKTDSKDSILNLLCAYKSLTANLDTMNVTKDDIIMHLVILPALSPTLRYKFEDHYGNVADTPTYQSMCNFLQHEYITASNRKSEKHSSKQDNKNTKTF
jgi:Protein of unknown function (DUF1759)